MGRRGGENTATQEAANTKWNSGAQALKGYAAHEIVGQHFAVFYTEEDRKRGLPEEILRRAVETGRCEHEGYRLRKDGSRFWADAVITPVRDAQARLAGFAKVTRDLSERKKAQDALRAANDLLEAKVQERTAALAFAEARYRRIVETTSQGIWMLDAGGNTVFTNRRFARMMGYEPDEMLGRHWKQFLEPSEHEAGIGRLKQRRAGEEAQVECRLLRKDGSTFWASAAATPIMDEKGRYGGSVSMLTDVTERRHGEEARARLAAIVEASGEAIWTSDENNRAISWNLAAEKLLGYSAEEALGQGPELICLPEYMGELAAMAARLQRGETRVHFETKRRHKSGALIDVSLTGMLIRNASGQTERCVMARDLTEQKRAAAALARSEEQLLHSQKMEAVGRLAGGVAHDFNNVLSVILGYGGSIQHDLPPNDPLREDMAEILKAAKRAADLTRQLLLFSRQEVAARRTLELDALVANNERMAKRILGEDIELAVVRAPELGRVRADPGSIEQVLMNLVINARDAMPRGGRLTIETANVTLGEEMQTHLGAKSGPHVMLAVSDTGTGMDKETQRRIFEPFFTTKEVGKGTGLGLSTVFGIVQQHEGTIWVYSEPGRGSTFKVYLPRTDAPIEEAPAHDTFARRSGTETVLLVEDEDQVRAVAQTILRRHGYQVLAARNGGEAVLLSESLSAPIHLLLTDLVMPRMSGAEVVRRLSPTRPQMKVICMSGYTDDSVVRYGILESKIAFLQKPFTPEVPTQRVREVLDDREEKYSAQAASARLSKGAPPEDDRT